MYILHFARLLLWIFAVIALILFVRHQDRQLVCISITLEV